MASISQEQLRGLAGKAVKIRQLIIEALLEAGSGHSAGPLGMADIFSAFYFHILKHDPQKPTWSERDRLVLSNGHICPVHYATLALAGYFPVVELKTLRKINSRLQGHPQRGSLPGVETTSGPLGEGLSQACGMALAARLNKESHHIYCLTSDGEHQEGNTWEAIMFAAKYQLDNLTVVIDRNYIQIDGPTEEIMPLDPLRQKYKAFNWDVIEVDGNNIEEFVKASNKRQETRDRPVVIIARTIPGKGVSFMENDYRWHGLPPNKEQAQEALKQLKVLEDKITN